MESLPKNLLTLHSTVSKPDTENELMKHYRAMLVEKINAKKQLVVPVDQYSIRAEIEKKLAAGESISVAGAPSITINLDMPLGYRKKLVWELYNLFPGKLEVEVTVHVMYADSSSNKWITVESDSDLSDFMPLNTIKLHLSRPVGVGDKSPTPPSYPTGETDASHKDKKLKQ